MVCSEDRECAEESVCILVTHQHVLLQYTGIYHTMNVPGSVLMDFYYNTLGINY